MTTRSKALCWISRVILGGAFALCALSFTATAWCQPPSTTAPAAGGATPGPGSSRDDQAAAEAQGAREVLEAQLEAKRTLLRIDESRAEQAKRWKAYYEKLVSDGRVTEDRLLAARDDVLMMEAHIAAERAELKVAEIRVKNARRSAASGTQATGGADQAREEVEVLEALLEAKGASLRVAEARADQAKRAEAHYEKLFRDGKVNEDRLLAVRDDALLMESVLAWGRADLKVAEIRVKTARRLAAHGESTADGGGRRLAELEERLAEAEMKADVLQHEVGRLRRELPHERPGAR
jgi:hypothetical protein